MLHSLSPVNILLTPSAFPSPSVDFTKPLIKLTDPGLSQMIDTANPLLSTRCGSEAYTAPKLVIGIGCIASQNPAAGLMADNLDNKRMVLWPQNGHLGCGRCHICSYVQSFILWGGVPVGRDDQNDWRTKVRGREWEREREHKSWLMCWVSMKNDISNKS